MIHDESTSKIPAVSRDTRQDASLSARLGLPSPPIFLRFAFHCRRIRILALDPVPGAAGRIRGVATLRHDPLQAQLAGMLLVEPQPWLSTREDALKQSATARPKVGARRLWAGTARRSPPSGHADE